MQVFIKERLGSIPPADITAKHARRIAPYGDLRRANKLGVHFRRQKIIQGFIVDFYCHKAGLVVEVDGDVHDLQKEEDERREKVLSALGLRMVRFRNDEVVRYLSAVVGKIKTMVSGKI